MEQITDAYLDGMGKALVNLWDDVVELFGILANLDEHAAKLLEFINEADFEKLKAQAKELLGTALLIASDEPLRSSMPAPSCAGPSCCRLRLLRKWSRNSPPACSSIFCSASS
ncbi:hypothetical protein P4203_29615 [Pseudomonas aeruginosa]|nr:hypothetical protein [Pseudomonas aeruginosa]